MELGLKGEGGGGGENPELSDHWMRLAANAFTHVHHERLETIRNGVYVADPLNQGCIKGRGTT